MNIIDKIALEGKSAIKCCEIVCEYEKDRAIDSETIRDWIKGWGGSHYKVSNIERRLRESDKIRSVKVKGKSYVKYQWIA